MQYEVRVNIIISELWIPCPRTNTPTENVETPSAFQTSFLEAMLGELGRLSRLETRHGAFSTFRQQILRGGYIAWRILRSRTLEGPAGWSFDPSAEGAMTAARPLLSLFICPWLSFCRRTAVSVRVVTYSSRCSLTGRTLCQRRDKRDHDPPAVLTRRSYWRLTAVDLSATLVHS